MNNIATQLRNNLIAIPSLNHPADTTLCDATAANLLTYGILIDPEKLHGASTTFLTNLNTAARKLRGADRTWDTFYPNFPKGVQETDELTLIIQQLAHYWTHGHYTPQEPDNKRDELPLEEMLTGATRVDVLRDPADAPDIIARRINHPTALPPQDAEYLAELTSLVSKDDILNIGDTTRRARFKENVGLWHVAVACQSAVEDPDFVVDLVNTVDSADVLLRLILALYVYPQNVEDIEETADNIARFKTLDRGTKTQPVPRRVRRAIVSRLPHTVHNKHFPADALLMRAGLWKRVLSSIHAFDYARDEQVKYLLDSLFDNNDYTSLNALADQGLQDSATTRMAVDALALHAPGRLMRNVVAFSVNDFAATVAAVSQCADRVAVTTLVSAVNAVRSAASGGQRYRRIAGGSTSLVEDEVRLSDAQAQELEECIVTRGIRPSLTKIPLPEGPVGVRGGEVAVPLSVVGRSATKTDRRRMVQGERMMLPGSGGVVRFFMHWYDCEDSYGGTDLDLGLVLLDEDMGVIDTWDYADVHSSSHGTNETVTFSGDSVRAPRPDGASEFFDVDMAKLVQEYPSARYMVENVRVFSGASSISAVDNYCGVMRRDKVMSGEVFDARTVVSGACASTGSKFVVLLAVDVVTGELVWLDTETGSAELYGRASTDGEATGLAVGEVLGGSRVSVGELLGWWSGGRVDESVGVDWDMVFGLL